MSSKLVQWEKRDIDPMLLAYIGNIVEDVNHKFSFKFQIGNVTHQAPRFRTETKAEASREKLLQMRNGSNS